MSKWQQKDLSSLDYTLMFCCLIISFLSIPISSALYLGGIVTATIIFTIAGIFVSLGIKHRIKHRWHWQGIKGKDLYKAIGITFLYILMMPSLFVNLFYGISRDNGRGEFNWQPNNHFNPFEALTEAIKVFPEFISNSEHSLHLGFFCIMAINITFNILFTWKIIYLSEKEFLKDCKNPSPIKMGVLNTNQKTLR